MPKYRGKALYFVAHPKGFRKANYLRAAVAGVPLLHPMWVRDSIKAGMLIERTYNYVMPRYVRQS